MEGMAGCWWGGEGWGWGASWGHPWLTCTCPLLRAMPSLRCLARSSRSGGIWTCAIDGMEITYAYWPLALRPEAASKPSSPRAPSGNVKSGLQFPLKPSCSLLEPIHVSAHRAAPQCMRAFSYVASPDLSNDARRDVLLVVIPELQQEVLRACVYV